MPRSSAEIESGARRVRELRAGFFTPALAATRYRVQREIGKGAYGVVVAAEDRHAGGLVAVKRIRQCLRSPPMATRTLRELKFLRLLAPHQNIIQVRDVLLPSDAGSFDDTFVVFEHMPVDLGMLLERKVMLPPHHVKWFMFQLLRGIHYMHSANVFHRDLKPSNIVINQDCELRIIDFGLARASFDLGPETLLWTDYVATRWYRAPELIMEDYHKYSTAIDMWSVGCIFAELLSGGTVLFPGGSREHQLHLITELLGSPPASLVDQLPNPSARRLLAQMQHPHRPPRDLRAHFPAADPDALAVLARLLVFDPDARLSAHEALHMPYFGEYLHLGLGPAASPLPAAEFEFERRRLAPDEMRLEFLREILMYHPEESAAVLEKFYTGDGVRARSSSAHVAGAMDRLSVGGPAGAADPARSMTLEEKLLHAVTDDEARGRAQAFRQDRQHVTMSEAEIEHFTKQ